MRHLLRSGRIDPAKLTLVASLTAAVAFGCGRKKDDDEDDDTATTAVPTASVSGGGASATFGNLLPASLAVASPLAAAGGATLALQQPSPDAAPTDFNSRKEEGEAILAAKDAAGCAYLAQQPVGIKPECYGPAILYRSHPDAPPGDPKTNGQLPSGDLGIWESTAGASGEACIAAKMNYEIESVAAKADRAIKTSLMVACAANLAGEALPGAGESKDLTAAVNAALADQEIGGEITAASVTRDADVDGRPVYTTAVTFAGTTGSLDVSVRHLALDDGNLTYKGKLWTTFKEAAGNPDSSKLMAISIAYEKASDTAISYEMRQSRFAEADLANAFDADHDTQTPVNNDGFSWGVFALNPSDGSGRVAYAWVAGTKMENLRSFVAQVDANDGVRTGVGYYGYGDSLQNVLADPTRAGWLDRMICNWAGPSNDHTGIAAVQRQELAADNAGVFLPVTSNITYVPRKSCGSGEPENTSFDWKREMNGTPDYVAFPATHDLVPIADLEAADVDALKVPAAPSTF